MTASRTHSKLISTAIKKSGDVYIAKSSTLKGLLVVSKDLDRLRDELIPEAIRDLYQACGVRMVVTRLDSPDEGDWIATPLSAVTDEAARADAAA